MPNCYRPFHIVCEGCSEENYIKELSRFLREESVGVLLIPYNAGGGKCSAVVKKYKGILKGNRNIKDSIRIWVDDDIYVRNDSGSCTEAFRNLSGEVKGKFLFSTHNFEDFLALHLDEERLQAWLTVCGEHNHFKNPLYAAGEDGYEALFRTTLFPGYRKGDLPLDLNKSAFRNLLRHSENPSIPLKSDFASFLKDRIFPQNFL